MDVHAVAGSEGSSSGEKLARRPRRRATSRTTSLQHHAAVGGSRPPRGVSTGISNWWGANSAKNRSGCTPASTSAPMTSAANGSARRSASSENGAAGGPSEDAPPSVAPARARPACPARRQELELVLEARAARGRRTRARAPRARSRRNRRGQHSHGVRRSRRCRTAPAPAASGRSGAARFRLDAHVRPGSGSRRRSPVEPNGVRSASGPCGVSAWLAGTQPTPAPQAARRARREQRAAAHDPAEVTAHERDQLGGLTRASRRLRDGAVVPVPSRNPSSRAPARTCAAASAARARPTTPPAGLSGRSIAAARRSAGCMCTPPAPSEG